MHILRKFSIVAVLTLVGVAAQTSAFAQTVTFGDGVRGNRLVVGIIGCSVHSSHGLVVEFVQLHNYDPGIVATTTSTPESIIGKSCAKGLIALQRRGLRLGQLVASKAFASVPDSPDCLIWEVTDAGAAGRREWWD